MKTSWRRVAEELGWCLEKINIAESDQNRHRAAQINATVRYGLTLLIAARSGEDLPERPDIDRAI